MPWHQVVIKHSDDEMIEQLSMQRLIVPFIGIIRKRRAVGASQDDIEVWLCLDDGCDRIYYFSPKAAEIAIADNIFRGFNASVCSKKPDLEGYSSPFAVQKVQKRNFWGACRLFAKIEVSV